MCRFNSQQCQHQIPTNVAWFSSSRTIDSSTDPKIKTRWVCAWRAERTWKRTKCSGRKWHQKLHWISSPWEEREGWHEGCSFFFWPFVGQKRKNIGACGLREMSTISVLFLFWSNSPPHSCFRGKYCRSAKVSITAHSKFFCAKTFPVKGFFPRQITWNTGRRKISVESSLVFTL